MRYINILTLICLLGMMGCRDKYPIPASQKQVNLLVIEGNITPGNDITRIRITRTYDLGDTSSAREVTNAVVSIEARSGISVSLPSTGNGYYSRNTVINPADEYRLRVRTAEGKNYVSAYLKPRITPAIDSIGFREANGRTEILANTKDPAGLSKYYRWDFDETWEIQSKYFTTWKWDGVNVVPRPVNDYAFTCYKFGNSQAVILGSSDQLSVDRIADKVVQSIPPNDERLGVRYSILLRQYAIDKDAYDFFQILKRNTENVGSIFDAQPSEMPTNIRCETDSTEDVVGFITSSSASTKRIFIKSSQVPWNNFQLSCRLYDVPNEPDSLRAYFPALLPYNPLTSSGGVLLAWQSASAGCVDCRLRGGILNKPSYW